MTYLALDCEMGGREIEFSLLQAYFSVLDKNFTPLDELNLLLKPDNNIYIVSGQGMSVNQINLQEHDKVALSYKQAKPLLYDFLKRNGSGTRLTPVGHGIRGDIDFLLKYLISVGSWEQFCTYHYLDTSVILQFLRACGKMPVDQDGSVGALATYFNLPINGDLHDAKVDAQTTAMILKCFVGLTK